METMFLICGIPAPQKTKLICEVAKAKEVVVLSFNKIRNELFPYEPYRRSQSNPTFQELHQRIMAAMQTGKDLVIDDVSRLRAERARHIKRARKHHYKTVCIFCDSDIASAIKDNHARPQEDIRARDDYYIRFLYHSFEEPDLTEGWDELYVKHAPFGERSTSK